jgi:hypothetical protein
VHRVTAWARWRRPAPVRAVHRDHALRQCAGRRTAS